MSGQDKRDNLDAEPAEPTLADVLLSMRRQIALLLRVAAPARVVSYNALTQRADVTLELLPVGYVEGVEVPQEPIAIPDVPVRFLSSGPTDYVSVPVRPGTTGHVIVMDRCIDPWLKAGVPIDPVLPRCHALADAVFEPGLHADTAPLVPPPSVAAVTVEGAQVHLGANAVSSAILGTEFLVALATAAAAASAAAIPGDGGDAAFVAFLGSLQATQATYLSQKVRVAP